VTKQSVQRAFVNHVSYLSQPEEDKWSVIDSAAA
jgi:hypothetical protein